MRNIYSVFFFFCLLFFEISNSFGQIVPESSYPKTFDNPQKVQFFDKKSDNVRIWVSFEQLSSNTYERAFLATVIETKAEFKDKFGAKPYFGLILYSFDQTVSDITVKKWIDDAFIYMNAIKKKSQAVEYEANLKQEVQTLRK